MRSASGSAAPSRLRLAFAALAAVFLIVPLIVSLPLLDPDEGLHAAIAQEMVIHHDYVTPTFLREPFLDKPILFFWTEALSLRVFGMREIAVRIPPLVFGLLGMLAVAALARTLFDEQRALIAGIVYASMLLPLGVSQVAVHDVALVPFMCSAAICLFHAARSPHAARWGIAIGLCLGLSILTKGLVGVVFTGIFGLCLAAADRGSFRRIVTALAVGIAVAAILAAPWYIAMERAHPGYLHYYFVERHVRAYLTPTQPHAGRPWWYYAPIVIGGTLPWTGFLVGAVRAAWRDRARILPLLLIAWAAIGLVFLSAGESKLITYVLPVVPALAIVVADYLVTAWRPRAAAWRWAAAVSLLFAVLLPPVAAAALHRVFAPSGNAALIAAAFASAVTLIAAADAWRARTLQRFTTSAAGATALSFSILMTLVAPQMAAWMTSRDLARVLNRQGTLPSRVLIVGERVGSLVFYLSDPLRREANGDRITNVPMTEDVFEALSGDPPDTLLAVRDDRLERFIRLFPVAPIADGRAGTFTLFRVEQMRAALASPPR
jgi:4-amino-4-deoxy-L-arabinose transferase-like glycosyltransferase